MGTTTRLTHYARRPTNLIDMKALRAEVMPKLGAKVRVQTLNRFKQKSRTPISEMCVRMGQTDTRTQEWLILNNKNISPAKEAFPRPAKRTDGSYIYERVPNQGGEGPAPGRQQMLYKKRPYDEKPVEHAVPSKVGKAGASKQGRWWTENCYKLAGCTG